MKIGFDARMIGHPGVGRYIKNILSAMLAKVDHSSFVLYGDPEKLRDFEGVRIRDYRAPVYGLNEYIFDPFSGEKLDLVHIPHFNAPFRKKNKLVITIHDLIYLKFPEFLPRFKTSAVKVVIANAVKKADRIIAVSENTRKDIIEFCPAAAEKTDVIYEAADSVFKIVDSEREKGRARRRYSLPLEIILFVGSLKRHKNIERLIDAYSELKAKGIRHRLVLVGRYRPREAEILKKIKTTDAIYLQDVPADDLVAIYNIASVLVMPSLYEGFGFPALEAMACGVPVVASSESSLPEIIGRAGLFFNPLSASSISERISQVLEDEALRRALIEEGQRRAALFSWDKSAAKTLALYRKAAMFM